MATPPPKMPPRQPPRFVPTLTDVVQVPGQPPVPPTKPVQPPGAGLPSAGRAHQPQPVTPPKAQPFPSPAAPAFSVHPPAQASAQERAAAGGLPDDFDEYAVHRVMQRVDLVLDQRLREAIARVVQEQTRSMIPRLREEVEAVVRQAVNEAVADELAGGKTGR